MDQMLLEHIQETLARERFREDIIHTWHQLASYGPGWPGKDCTMLEVELDIVTSDIRGHSNNGCSIELADKMASRHAI